MTIIRRDVDSLFAKFMRWGRSAADLGTGQSQRTENVKAGEEEKEETLIIENDYEWAKVGAINTPDPDTPNECFCVAKMNDNETVSMSEKPYKTISAARAAATIKAKAEQGRNIHHLQAHRLLAFRAVGV